MSATHFTFDALPPSVEPAKTNVGHDLQELWIEVSEIPSHCFGRVQVSWTNSWPDQRDQVGQKEHPQIVDDPKGLVRFVLHISTKNHQRTM